MSADQTSDLAQRLARLAQHLASEVVGGPGGRCEVTADDQDPRHASRGRCSRHAVAIRWEAGFADVVCREHAATAAGRGAVVVYPLRHDGTERTTRQP